MAADLDVRRELARHLGDATSAFSVGSLGAIAEFHRRADEPLLIDDRAELRIATERGALSIGEIDEVVPLAYEIPGRHADRWQHGVEFCLPARRAAGARRTVLTAFGPDRRAVRPKDREAMLFDMGLGAANVDFCIRTADRALARDLEGLCGRSVFEDGNPAMAMIMEANPHRVAISALARAEVFQPIGRTVTPEGPHTHVLPKLLATGRTHVATIPVPRGMMPCLSLYPANPLVDALGEPIAFDRARLDAFAPYVAAWANADYRAEKDRVARALAAGQAPEAYDGGASRPARAALKVALRQHRQTAADDDPILAAWSQAFERRA